jgi:hypothetical protein
MIVPLPISILLFHDKRTQCRFKLLEALILVLIATTTSRFGPRPSLVITIGVWLVSYTQHPVDIFLRLSMNPPS